MKSHQRNLLLVSIAALLASIVAVFIATRDPLPFADSCSPGPAGSPGSPGSPGPAGSPGSPGPAGSPGSDIQCPAIPYTALASDLIPAIDNYYSLGTPQFRWKGLQLGPGTLYLQDVITGIQAGITVSGGSLLIDGADSLRIGNIRLTSNGIESIASSQDIQIGTPGDSGYLSTARGIKFPDGSIQSSAAEEGPEGPTGPVGPTGAPGGFGLWAHVTDSVTQTNPSPGAINKIQMRDPMVANGITITGTLSSEIRVSQPGTYSLAFSLQVDNSNINSDEFLEIWLMKNGTGVANSNTKVTIPKKSVGAYVAAWNFFFTTTSANEYVEIAWASSENTMKILAIPDSQTPVGPAVPSVIVTVNQVGD